MAGDYFIEVEYYQKCKHGQIARGDGFFSRKIKNRQRVIVVLSDGLGSGVKANVLATLTGSMLLNFVENKIDVKKTAEIIMRTLPVDSERRISYSTFTIVDIDREGTTSIIEYDNPEYILMRNGKAIDIEKKLVKVSDYTGKERKVYYSTFKAKIGDHLAVFSDGVAQSGMGTKPFPLGWTNAGVKKYVVDLIANEEDVSARDLAQTIVRQSWAYDGYRAIDDITCGVIYFRKPRRLMLLTGPPFSKDKDKELSEMLSNFEGKKVICGGTTANIISRELNKKVKVILRNPDREIPPYSEMDGIELVTEGIITLGKVAEYLESGDVTDFDRSNAATMLIEQLLDSDIVSLVVGTRINEAHQDPNMPVELEIRRNIVKKIARLLEDKYLKEVRVQYI